MNARQKYWRRIGRGVLLLGFLLLGSNSSQLCSAETTPRSREELSRQAYLDERGGRRALSQEDHQGAYEALCSAQECYRLILEHYPDWRPEVVAARIAALGAEAETVGRVAFTLPPGLVEIEAGMIREGTREADGRTQRDRVRAQGEGEYEVAGHTVRLERAGPRLGATCSCPDFTYRGRSYGFACRHIWAVIHREQLLK